MSDYFATLNGLPCRTARLEVPWTGTWLADLELHEPVDLPKGLAELKLGDTTFRGTCDPSRSGSWAGGMHVLMLGGAGAWGKTLGAKGYHNDGGVKRSLVALDAAKELGETLVVGSDVDGVAGADFSRETAPGARLLEQLFPGVAWWVGADGVTRVGTRTTRDVSLAVQLLSVDPTAKSAEIALEEGDVSALLPGCSVLDAERLGATPFVIHDVTITVNASKVRALARGGSSRDAALLRVLRALGREEDSRRTFFGIYRYRVFQMSSGRVQLQAFNPLAGLPDQIPLDMWPGLAGAKAELTPGAVVLVQFLEGDPGLPVVTHFSRSSDAGFAPAEIAIDATSKITIGASTQRLDLAGAFAEVLRNGEAVRMQGSGAVTAGGSGSFDVVGTISLAPTIVSPGPPPTGKSKVKA